jgi:hypothetical protein
VCVYAFMYVNTYILIHTHTLTQQRIVLVTGLTERLQNVKKKKKTPWLLVRERTIPTERPPLVGVVPTFANRGCRVVSATDPRGR